MPRTPVLLVLLAALTFAISCSSTQQITTAPPRSGVPADTSTIAESRAPLAVHLTPSGTTLPEGVHSLRFRISDVWLKEAGGEWIRMPADVNQIVLPPTQRASRPILTTFIPPGKYDSLGLSFSDVFVLFDENSGSPLTMPREAPARMAFPLEAATGEPTTIRLAFEPMPSLTRTEACRWFFVPFIIPDEERR